MIDLEAILTNQHLFKHHVINDLAWVIRSPGLLNDAIKYVLTSDQCQALYSEIDTTLHKLDQFPADYPSSLTNPKPYVGDYFENLIAFWLEQRKDIENINRRQVVTENKRTVGEFDFLFTNKTLQKSYHWEVAIKFYLYYESEHGVEFYGPNSKDRLALKVDKMRNQQILLSRKQAAQNAISNYYSPLYSQIILKGYLFYPTHQNIVDHDNIPDYVSDNHLRGWWTYADSLHIPQHHDDSQWLILNKPYWISVVTSSNTNKNLLNYNRLADYIKVHFQSTQKPLFLAEVMQNSDGALQERSRGFVVPNNWPQNINKN